MEIFRVPTREVAAFLMLDDGRSLEGKLFLHEQGPDGHPERVLDRLNDGAEPFVPLAVGSDRFLLNKSGIITVELEASEDDVGHLDPPGARRAAVRITLAGGTALLGELVVLMPPERSRVLDYLNAAPRFVPLFREGRVTLVQRSFIVTVRAGTDPA